MFGIGVIVFREVLEMALILSVMLAATRGLPGRKLWITYGIVGGLLGSALVALFADRISALAEGVGQEIFNAAILASAAILIGWTVVWMSTHAREMMSKLKTVSNAVVAGESPIYSLSIVAALAILREGSEIVLFTFGLMTGGTTWYQVLFGGSIGFVGGAAIGLALYLGLVRISPKHFFNVAGVLLIFLAASMMSQAVGFLAASGWISELVSPLWDTSAILSEKSFLGQILHALVGYKAQPSGSEVIAFVLTAGVLAMWLKWMKRPSKVVIAIVMAFVLMSSNNSWAFQKVFSPHVEQGEWELEYRSGYFHDNANDIIDDAQLHRWGLGYGVSNRWFTELEVVSAQSEDESLEIQTYEWENIFQLTEPGKYWADWGLYLSYERNLNTQAPDVIEAKILAEKTIDRWIYTANLNLEQEIGPDADDASGLETGLALKGKYSVQKWFEPGIEYYSEFGKIYHMDSTENQEHQAGPMIYGKVGPVKYETGYLWGLNDSSPKGEAKLILEYEFRF